MNCDGYDGKHGFSKRLGGPWVTLVFHDGRVRRFCDGDCLRRYVETERAAYEAQLRVSAVTL